VDSILHFAKAIRPNGLYHCECKLICTPTGPFIIRTVFSHGAIEIEDPKNGNTFKVNGQRVKQLLELRSLEVEATLLEDPIYTK
jgi:hypothetical protein